MIEALLVAIVIALIALVVIAPNRDTDAPASQEWSESEGLPTGERRHE